ncbi:unnamed protein product [Rotaria magnacalcarata]|uniref:UBC core domain-containing protein n=1 Tax=Rotaria magnacalcarata TaxID=392030 RepID=A0A819PVQ0_9BILA|nr:unnamed protein product [Rotaria magnacalcarata]CAF2153552.1 unnamed protein product [Rotaria magnacalcarata]CAF4017124.1 unnamed protein product [Rotaria magnacalcarata]CAF4071880.1 unnamed protein product [Rotaria magnacalcarata]
MNVNTRSSKRILAEIKHLKEDPDVQSYFQYENSGNDERSGRFCLYGYILPRAKPYKYGSFKINIILSPCFPFEIPEIQLLTYMYHPAATANVSTPYISKVCTCCWEFKPTDRISVLIKLFVNMIDDPETFSKTYCNFNQEALSMYFRSRDEYEEHAMAMVIKYAYPRVHPSMISLKFAAKTIIRKQLNFDVEKIYQLPLPNCLKQYIDKPQ